MPTKVGVVIADTKAKSQGEVRIKRKDGDEFVVKPILKKISHLDVEGVSLGLSVEEIVSAIRESRERP